MLFQLSYKPKNKKQRWCREPELNRRRPPFQGGALPTELSRRKFLWLRIRGSNPGPRIQSAVSYQLDESGIRQPWDWMLKKLSTRHLINTGARDRNRTCGILFGREALCLLSYTCVKNKNPGQFPGRGPSKSKIGMMTIPRLNLSQSANHCRRRAVRPARGALNGNTSSSS